MRVQITVPKNTPRTNPLVTQLQYGGGHMNQQIVRIPDGHAGLTGLQMFAGHAHARVLPEYDSNTEWLTDNGRTIEKHIDLRFDPPVFEVVFRTYNEDDTYPHSFYVDLDKV